MLARVATFANRDVSRVDELIGIVRSRAVSGHEVPEALRHVMLLDPRERSALGVTFFESEDALQASEPEFERLGDEIPEPALGRRTSVGVYEVAIADVEGATGAARVATLECPPERLAEALHSIREQAKAEAEELGGWKGIVALVDRTSGATKTITFWDSDDALRRSEVRETQLRCRVVAAADGSIANVRTYDVAVHEAPVAA